MSDMTDVTDRTDSIDKTEFGLLVVYVMLRVGMLIGSPMINCRKARSN